MIRDKYYELYESYKHYSVDRADKEFEEAQNSWYKVTTINWTIASDNRRQIHKNIYIWTLAELIDFIRNTKEVVEDIINIEPCNSEEIK